MGKQFENINLLISDFDGVFTDGTVYVNQNEVETVRCSRKDGLGVEMLKKNGFDVVVISKEVNPVVQARCKKLKIECYQKVENSDKKLEIVRRVSEERRVPMDNIAYVGDDLNDMQVFGNVGLSITVADGHRVLKEKADFITNASGGKHVIREIAELILEAKGIDLIF